MPRSELVSLELAEVRGLRMALRFGVPDPEPSEIASARQKLGEAQRRLEGPDAPVDLLDRTWSIRVCEGCGEHLKSNEIHSRGYHGPESSAVLWVTVAAARVLDA